jgi:hypothetical protein
LFYFFNKKKNIKKINCIFWQANTDQVEIELDKTKIVTATQALIQEKNVKVTDQMFKLWPMTLKDRS